MTDVNLQKKLPSKPIDFVERNDLKGFLALLRDWMAIFLIAALSIWANNVFIYLVSVWAIGIFQFAIGEALLHEASHNNLFEKQLWNERLEFLYGFPVLRTISSYREHHFPHHKGLGGEEDYIPEYYEMLGLYKEDKNLFWLLFVKPVMGFALYHFLIDAYFHLKNLDYHPFKTGFKVFVFWLVFVLSFYLSGHIDILLLYWLVPLVWCFPCYTFWSEVHDHLNTVSGTRSNLNFLANLLTHNNGYHYLHHLCPAIPWYNLPQAHQALCADSPDVSYGLFDVYRKLTRTEAQSLSS